MASDTLIAAVVGHPVSHSLSPVIFSFLAKRLGYDLMYRKLDLELSEIGPFFEVAKKNQLFLGWNVTLPHKETVCGLVDELSQEAETIGAVNVVKFSARKTKGFNTDFLGIRSTLEEQKLSLRGNSALLLGAGGAAKAVAYALGKSGARTVWVVNRTPQAARALCRHFSKVFPRTQFQVAASVDEIRDIIHLVVNSTPVGMKGTAGHFRFPLHLDPIALAFDLIYRPAQTVFLKQARSEGLRTVNGLDMLLWQAIATWELWFGRLENRADLKKQLKSQLENYL